MMRHQRIISWLLNSVGGSLLVFSIMIAPSSAIMGQSGGEGNCPGDVCSTGCRTLGCDQLACIAMVGNCTPSCNANMAGCPSCVCDLGVDLKCHCL